MKSKSLQALIIIIRESDIQKSDSAPGSQAADIKAVNNRKCQEALRMAAVSIPLHYLFPYL